MTGNTKVWRAPLAGLASVAMIATMGVAASTANAVDEFGGDGPQYPDVTVTLDANGGKFASSLSSDFVDAKGTKLSVTDSKTTDAEGYQYADGVFGKDLYAKYGTDTAVVNPDYVFTGWYTSPDAGGQAVDPNAKLNDGDTLYAHWAVKYSDESENVVKFNLYNATSGSTLAVAENPDGASGVVSINNTTKPNTEVDVRLADGDEVADWQVPSADTTGDGWLFKGWDKDVASAVRGTTLTAQADPGLTVNLTNTDVKLFKDGALISGNKFDVARNGSAFDSVQAVKGEGGASVQLAYNWTWTAGSDNTIKGTTNHGEALTVPEGVGSIKATAQGWQNATEYVIHPVSVVDAKYNKYYFTNANSSFVDAYGQEKLDELSPRVNNDAFLGWYQLRQEFKIGTKTYRVEQFFDSSLIKIQSEWDKIAPNTVPTFNFANQYGQGVVNVFAGYEASAKYVTVNVKPLYDQAKTISAKLYDNKTVAEQLAAIAPDRAGYSVEGYYLKSNNGLPVANSKISDTDTVAYLKLISGTDIYVNYTADSKYGVNGLLTNLARGYVTGLTTSPAVNAEGITIPSLHYPTYTVPNVPVKVDGAYKVDGKTQAYARTGSGSYVLVQPEGYTDASWKSFLATRKSVVTDLQKYFKVSTHGTDAQAQAEDIVEVYNLVATKLSAEKADEFNQEFFGELKPETAYPDVNYDDYGTHSDEITYLTTKGIVKGYADGTFGYGAKLARVDYIVWLYRAAGSPKVDAQAPFTDVNATTVPNQEFRDAIAWAASTGVTKGYSDGTFAPYATLNRQDAAAFLYRAAGSPKFNESYADVKFGDVTAGDSANHSQAVLWAASNGIVKGYAGGDVTYFGGYSTLVRQDAAAFLARTLQANLIK